MQTKEAPFFVVVVGPNTYCLWLVKLCELNWKKKKKKKKYSVVCCTMHTTRLKVTFLTANELTCRKMWLRSQEKKTTKICLFFVSFTMCKLFWKQNVCIVRCYMMWSQRFHCDYYSKFCAGFIYFFFRKTEAMIEQKFYSKINKHRHIHINES